MIDKKIKKHKFGYKTFIREGDHFLTSVRKDAFLTSVRKDGPFHLGKTYKIKMQEKLPCNHNGEEYNSGFHYYLRLKDAKNEGNYKRIVIRILVEDIEVTGSQWHHSCGVAKTITLDRIMFDGKKALEKKKENAKKDFIKSCKKDVPTEILKYLKDHINLKKHFCKKPADKELKKLLDFLTESREKFWKMVNFGDILPRYSQAFQLLTILHFYGTKKHDGYKKIFYKMSYKEMMVCRKPPMAIYLFATISDNIDELISNDFRKPRKKQAKKK